MSRTKLVQSPSDVKQPKQPKKGGRTTPTATTRPALPTLSEFLKEADRLRERAVTVLAKDGVHTPIVIATKQDGHRETFSIRLEPGAPSFGEILKDLVRRREIFCFVTIAEAWMTRNEALRPDVPPSQSPGREQVLMIGAHHPDGAKMWATPFAWDGERLILGTVIDSTGLSLAGGIPEALTGTEGQP